MSKRIPGLSHIVLLHRHNIQKASQTLGNRQLALLVFLAVQCRNTNPVCWWGVQALRKFLGWDTRTVKAQLTNLERLGWIDRAIQLGGLEIITVNIVLNTEKDNNQDSILWRCGPIQNEKLGEIGPAVKTLAVLAAHADSKTLKIQNDNQSLAEFVSKNGNLSIPTVHRHIAILKRAGLLHSYPGRPGRKRNQHDWYLSARILKKLSE